jgi:SAM-dependent methyltransferase
MGDAAAGKPSVCPICGSREWDSLLTGLEDRQYDIPGSFDVWRCEGCSVWRVWPLPADMALHYPADYGAHVNMVEVGKKRPWHPDMWVASFQPSSPLHGLAKSRLSPNEAAREMWTYLESAPHSVLDYGCGSGRFLRYADQLGMEVLGVDLSSNAVESAESVGIRCIQGTYADLSAVDRQFDVVRLNHVLEHVDDPVEALRALRPLVARDGRLVIAVPNTESPVAQLYGRDWHNLDAPRHVWDFNPASLRRAFDAAGYSVERVLFNGVGDSIYHSMRFQLERAGEGAWVMPAWSAVAEGLTTIAASWNAQNAGDWMIMTGKVKNG